MDHQFHVIFTLAVCVLAWLFALLHGIAAGSQLYKKTGSVPALLMLGGSLGVLAAGIDCLVGGGLDWLLMLLGGTIVCTAALCNGKRAGNLHLSHHLIRLGLVLALACAMAWV